MIRAEQTTAGRKPGLFFFPVPDYNSGMVNLDDFRAGQFRVPFGCADELPSCCFSCIYLQPEESTVCFCDAPFYYFCAYSWPDRLTQTDPACLKESPPQD